MNAQSTTRQTKAEAKANHYAAKLAANGWTVKVTITDNAASYYDEGDVMLPGFRQASFIAHRAWYDTTISGHWMTYTEVAEGRQRTTSYTGGSRFTLTQGVKDVKSERSLAIYVDIDATDSNTTGAEGSVTVVHEEPRTR